ncbi:hypothetical protein VF21_08700 [Pseudogymnoascus sp. 05NY08]|nr:hypothetical protein VF21_08700 [Pseudogymnoascus sp. 05NY08]
MKLTITPLFLTLSALSITHSSAAPAADFEWEWALGNPCKTPGQVCYSDYHSKLTCMSVPEAPPYGSSTRLVARKRGVESIMRITGLGVGRR